MSKNKGKQKGYILAIVLIFSFVLSMTITTTFSICYYYQKKSAQQIEELRTTVYVEEIKEEQEAN